MGVLFYHHYCDSVSLRTLIQKVVQSQHNIQKFAELGFMQCSEKPLTACNQFHYEPVFVFFLFLDEKIKMLYVMEVALSL